MAKSIIHRSIDYFAEAIVIVFTQTDKSYRKLTMTVSVRRITQNTAVMSDVKSCTRTTGWARDVSRKVNAYFSAISEPTKLVLHSSESPIHAICSLRFSDF